MHKSSRSGTSPMPAAALSIMPLQSDPSAVKGTALTVFQGVKPESMDVEVLGVLTT